MKKMSNVEFCTPKKPSQALLNKIKIPPSPYMKKIGFGTGVAVYELERSPAYNKCRSPWAIKKLLKGREVNSLLKDRLKNEAETLRKLVHPNVVGFRAFVESKDGNNILAMEECSSCLGDLIENRSDDEKGPFSAKTITKVAFDIAQALTYLHNTALLMHCDLKSYNILIKGNFEICKLCDFGISLPVNKDGHLDKEKAPGAEYAGTKSWCAPEILIYPQDITTKADIYSYGLIIWEMIALSPPLTEDILDSISEYSDMDPDQFDDLIEKMSSRSRPPIPSNIDLGDDYIPILEVYYCCTNENKDLRPPAVDLTKALEEIV